MKCEKNSIIELSTSKLIIALTQEIVFKLWSRFNVAERQTVIS